MPRVLIAKEPHRYSVTVPTNRIKEVDAYLKSEQEYLKAWDDLANRKITISHMQYISYEHEEKVKAIWDLIHIGGYDTQWEWDPLPEQEQRNREYVLNKLMRSRV